MRPSPMVTAVLRSMPRKQTSRTRSTRVVLRGCTARATVDIDSGTMDFAGVREVGGILRAELDKLGFQHDRRMGAAFGRAGHLIAERTGTGPRLLLIGHLDTVFEPTITFSVMRSSRIRRTRSGRVPDMKGGDVIMFRHSRRSRPLAFSTR